MYYLVLNILIFKYIRVTKGVEGKFLKSLIHIYVDLRRFCSLFWICIIQNVMGSDQSENCIFLREVLKIENHYFGLVSELLSSR